jgi:hypothetical protein
MISGHGSQNLEADREKFEALVRNLLHPKSVKEE